MSSNVMRPIEERHVPSQVELMVWCPCLDLLALSNSKGEVQLHRLNWHKVWSLAPPAEGSLVGGIAWRPDGKVLAVGYTCGKIYLVDVEDKEILFINKAGTDKSNPGAVTCLSWKQKCANTNSHVSYGNFNNVNTYLPLPPTINPSFKKNEKNALANDTKRKKELTELNIMLVGYENGEIHMSVFGQFLCGILNVNNYMDAQQNKVIEAKFTKIVDVRLSPDFTMIQVFYEADNKSMNLFMLNTETLAAFSEELHSLALMYVHLTSVINYIDGTVTSIIESWEQILLEMDSKLEKYACNVAEGGVSADFLDLLILGVPSAELKIFLLQDLTAKGLKKFGTSIELSYSTIQKLVLKQLNTVCQNLSFHLSDLRGLSRITHRYPVLGLDEDLVNFAIISSNAFVNKCLELQQVIEHSMKNYKAFFRWLFVVIVRLMDEHVPSDISKINQQDLTYIAEFLQNFDKVGVEKNPGPSGEGQSVDTGEKKRGKFSLERLGQYLVERELTMLPEDDNNPWKQFLSENPCLNNNPGIIQNFKKFSLVQQQGQLRYAIENVFRQSEKSLAQHYRAFLPIECVRSENMNNVRLTQINDLKANSVLVVFTDPDSQEAGCYFAEITFRNRIAYPKCAYFFFNIPLEVDESKLEDLAGDYLPVADAQFYSIDILSLLLKRPNDEEVCVFVQFPVEIIRKHLIEVTLEKGMSICSVESIEKKNAFSILEKTSFNVIDKLCGNKFAVSGSRKVAVVLSKTCRKVKLFEMEADGEEDDDETLDPNQTAHNSSQNSDPSQYVTMNESNFSTNPVNDDNQMEETEDSDDSSEMV